MGKEKEKKPKITYNVPTLWVHGGIEDLTQSAGMMGLKADTRGKIGDFKTN